MTGGHNPHVTVIAFLGKYQNRASAYSIRLAMCYLNVKVYHFRSISSQQLIGYNYFIEQ